MGKKVYLPTQAMPPVCTAPKGAEGMCPPQRLAGIGSVPAHGTTSPELAATRAGSSPTPGYHQVITPAHGTCLARLECGSPRAPPVSLPANVHLRQAREP